MLSPFGRDVLYVEVVYMTLLYSYTSDVNVFYELHWQAFYFFKKDKKQKKPKICTFGLSVTVVLYVSWGVVTNMKCTLSPQLWCHWKAFAHFPPKTRRKKRLWLYDSTSVSQNTRDLMVVLMTIMMLVSTKTLWTCNRCLSMCMFLQVKLRGSISIKISVEWLAEFLF